MLFDKLRNRSKPEYRDVVALGSSGTEVIDYVIGLNSQYHPFWASGWSARGLRNPQAMTYLETILQPVDRTAIVLLQFGATDVMMNARYKLASDGFFDLAAMMKEAAQGILDARQKILGLGFQTVVPVFFGPIAHQHQGYWNRFGKTRQLPSKAMGMMYHRIFEHVAKECETLDIFDQTTQGEAVGYVLGSDFMRPYPDHHADYRKIHTIVAAQLAQIDGMVPLRERPLEKHYPHKVSQIKKLMETGTTRPNTCQ